MAAFPFADHNPCRLDLILQFCIDSFIYLQDDQENVIAVHCKAGKGRTGLMICAYLLFSGVESAQQALELYARRRTYNGKGVTIPSQKRYVHYFEAYLRLKLKPPYRETIATILNDPFSLPELLADTTSQPLYLKSICIGPLSMKSQSFQVKLGDFENTERFVMIQEGTLRSSRLQSIFCKFQVHKIKEEGAKKQLYYYLIYLEEEFQLRGDVRVRFKGAGVSFRFWLNISAVKHSSERSYTGYLFRNSQCRVAIKKRNLQDEEEQYLSQDQCLLHNCKTEEEELIFQSQEADSEAEEVKDEEIRKRNDEKSQESEEESDISSNDYDSANLSDCEESVEMSFTKDFQSWGTPSRIADSESGRNTLNPNEEGFGILRNSEVISKASQKDGEDPDEEVPVEEEEHKQEDSNSEGSSQSVKQSRVEEGNEVQESKFIQLVRCETQERSFTIYQVVLNALQLDALKTKKKSKQLKKLKVKVCFLKL